MIVSEFDPLRIQKRRIDCIFWLLYCGVREFEAIYVKINTDHFAGFFCQIETNNQSINIFYDMVFGFVRKKKLNQYQFLLCTNFAFYLSTNQFTKQLLLVMLMSKFVSNCLHKRWKHLQARLFIRLDSIKTKVKQVINYTRVVLS